MYVPSCLEITVDYSFAWEQTQLAISHAFLTRMGSQQVVVTPDVLLLCQSKLHLMGKSALVSWRKIFCQWENMHIHALQGCWVWVCSTGMSSLTALLLSPNLETIVPGPIFNECPFGRAKRYLSETQKLPPGTLFSVQIFTWLGKNLQIWTITWP